jgi:hypothetical protein
MINDYWNRRPSPVHQLKASKKKSMNWVGGIQAYWLERRDWWGLAPPKLETCLTFCQNFEYFLRNFLQLRLTFWQKFGLSALFARGVRVLVPWGFRSQETEPTWQFIAVHFWAHWCLVGIFLSFWGKSLQIPENGSRAGLEMCRVTLPYAIL